MVLRFWGGARVHRLAKGSTQVAMGKQASKFGAEFPVQLFRVTHAPDAKPSHAL